MNTLSEKKSKKLRFDLEIKKFNTNGPWYLKKD